MIVFLGCELANQSADAPLGALQTIDVPDEYSSETAFAYDCFKGPECFLDLGFDRWGWTNGPFEPGDYVFDLFAGAGQCDLEKGTLVGQVLVYYDGENVLVDFMTCGSYVMTETHLYVGTDQLPKDKKGNPTVSPGKFTDKHDNLSDVSSDHYEIGGFSDEEIYVVAHAVVKGDYTQGDCEERGCFPECKIYLSESFANETPDNGSIIYTVVFQSGVAKLIEEIDLTGDNDKTTWDKPHLAVQPETGYLFLINNGDGNHLGVWDGMDLTDLGSVSGLPPSGTVLAAFSPDGDLYVANNNNWLYKIDFSTAPTVVQSWNLGPTVDIQGADMTWVGDVLYLWSNAQNRLWNITLDGGTAITEGLTITSGINFTGISGNCHDEKLMGSSNNMDRIYQIISSDGTIHEYSIPMYLDDSPYDHIYGDMAAGY
jgi:hypothetical protein